MAGNVPQGSGGLAMHDRGQAPGQTGQVQPVDVIQEVALQKLQPRKQKIAMQLACGCVHVQVHQQVGKVLGEVLTNNGLEGGC